MLRRLGVPSVVDRGGSLGDGVNFTQLLKDLRAAINAGGKSYIVTFTAPTLYWYLQNLDLAKRNIPEDLMKRYVSRNLRTPVISRNVMR